MVLEVNINIDILNNNDNFLVNDSLSNTIIT